LEIPQGLGSRVKSRVPSSHGHKLSSAQRPQTPPGAGWKLLRGATGRPGFRQHQQQVGTAGEGRPMESAEGAVSGGRVARTRPAPRAGPTGKGGPRRLPQGMGAQGEARETGNGGHQRRCRGCATAGAAASTAATCGRRRAGVAQARDGKARPVDQDALPGVAAGTFEICVCQLSPPGNEGQMSAPPMPGRTRSKRAQEHPAARAADRSNHRVTVSNAPRGSHQAGGRRGLVMKKPQVVGHAPLG